MTVAAYRDNVAKNVRTARTIINVIWLIVGIGQCCVLIMIPFGIWNIIAAVKALKNNKYVQPGEVWVIQAYKKSLFSLILTALYNMIVSAGVGTVLTIAEMFVRGYVLKNKTVFEPLNGD